MAVNRNPTPKPEAKQRKPKCLVVTIKAAFRLTDMRGFDDMLEPLREYGAAEVIDAEIIPADWYDMATLISTGTLNEDEP